MGQVHGSRRRGWTSFPGRRRADRTPGLAVAPASVTIYERKMVPEIVGRDADLAAVRAFVEGTDAASAALVLEGEAGIGKSTLWLAAVEHAHARGVSVLSARPAEAEQGLAHVGLGDLLDGIFHDLAPELSRPRRRALETALLREEAADETI